jgi:hypothetical protein
METQRIVNYALNYLCVDVKEHLPTVSPSGFYPKRAPIRKKCCAVVGLTGLEPVTLRLSSACSNQLSYRPAAGHARDLKSQI